MVTLYEGDFHFEDYTFETLLRRWLDGELPALESGEFYRADGTSENTARAERLPLRCPCCGCKTLDERGLWEICEVCFWEDDGQDDHNADEVSSGPNGPLSLTQARANYRRYGACEESMLGNVRPPRPEELPDERRV